MAKNYYQVLGVPKGASDKEVRQAYRRLARKYHPDVNRGDKGAEYQFKEINQAYEVISNPDSRKKYDTYGDQWRHAAQFQQAGAAGPATGHFRSSGTRTGRGGRGAGPEGAGNFGGLFGDLFGFGRGSRDPMEDVLRQEPVEVPLNITLEEAYNGSARILQMAPDPVTGAPGKRLEVEVPQGVATGSMIRIPGNSSASDRALALHLRVNVEPHKRFRRNGDDLKISVPVPVADAVLGGEVKVPTIKGKQVAMKLPPETQNGRTIRLKGQGMPKRKTPLQFGDLLVTVQLELPSLLTDEDRELFRKLRELHAS
jgi:DnaJ-class molecular chaperone